MFKTITRQQLLDLVKYGSGYSLVDVRGEESYAQEHIKGAISMPLDQIERRASQELRKEDLIVTYCTSFQCQASTSAAERLIAMGFTNVADYKGGIIDYKSVPLELEGKLHERVGQNNCCCNC